MIRLCLLFFLLFSSFSIPLSFSLLPHFLLILLNLPQSPLSSPLLPPLFLLFFLVLFFLHLLLILFLPALLFFLLFFFFFHIPSSLSFSSSSPSRDPPPPPPYLPLSSPPPPTFPPYPPSLLLPSSPPHDPPLPPPPPQSTSSPPGVKVTRLLYLHAARRPRDAALRPPTPVVATARCQSRPRSVTHSRGCSCILSWTPPSPSPTPSLLPPGHLRRTDGTHRLLPEVFFTSGGGDRTSPRSKTHSGFGFGLGGRRGRRLRESGRSG